MRESRHALLTNFWPASADEAVAIAKSDHPLNAAYRQVSTYWEMAYGMAKHGVIHADFMMESATEGMFILARVHPYLAELRKGNPTAFRNAEWMLANSQEARSAFERYRERVQQRLGAK